jgi:hypothetical protein
MKPINRNLFRTFVEFKMILRIIRKWSEFDLTYMVLSKAFYDIFLK